MTKHQRKSENNKNMAIVSSHSPRAKIISGTWIIVTANSEYLQHKCNTCKKGYVPIAYAPQESTSVQNVSVIILTVPKTIFQHQAELSR